MFTIFPSSIQQRRREKLAELAQIHASKDQARFCYERCLQLATELPAFLEEQRSQPHAPIVSASCCAEDAVDGQTLAIAQAIAAAERLLKDLPALTNHWRLAVEEAEEDSSAVQAEAHPSKPVEAAELITSLESYSIAGVLSLIESKKLTPARALELERAGKKRPSLMAQLAGEISSN